MRALTLLRVGWMRPYSGLTTLAPSPRQPLTLLLSEAKTGFEHHPTQDGGLSKSPSTSRHQSSQFSPWYAFSSLSLSLSFSLSLSLYSHTHTITWTHTQAPHPSPLTSDDADKDKKPRSEEETKKNTIEEHLQRSP